MNDLKIAFIGAGNMASSIIGGLLNQGMPAGNLCASDPYPEALQRLSETYGVSTSADNATAVADANVVILAVKPQIMPAVTRALAPSLQQHNPVVISIAAGITVSALQQQLGMTAAIVRCMPNTPALLQCGATAMFANEHTSQPQRNHAETILSAVGDAHWVRDENLLDAVTALSGSGPAYFFLFMEAMTAAGTSMGLKPELSRALTVQTALGAARMAAEGDVELDELRRRVTSPGGTTAAALDSFAESDLRGVVASAMQAALNRSIEMGREES
ncbi:pyrroline-5-carboxylate reductase [Halieaceae bacterium IMCC14734]|uniref:Pyrroline-5-carboxylate reductase n=1 Tax=Candidatus Litorirhabdus singularis TaxID=2518993 RepID=A0ABT3TF54_9GAMM|nr:pyrroline-5-carboxylate reductase [Candidatus Litorirhabdus singularis]MCX2980042.1 pyrroline-5-carboxylate reductase [Candidatus Litorirhabdus singularis]